jgi:hypothetical protein
MSETIQQITPVSLLSDFREFWGDVSAMCNDRMRKMFQDPCLRHRWYHAPNSADEVIPPPSASNTGYFPFTMQIPPGSYIWCIYHQQAAGFNCMITDMARSAKMFSDPIPDSIFTPSTVGNFPYLFVEPYLVLNPSIFLVEFWNPQTAENVTAQLTFGVAELIPELGGRQPELVKPL